MEQIRGKAVTGPSVPIAHAFFLSQQPLPAQPQLASARCLLPAPAAGVIAGRDSERGGAARAGIVASREREKEVGRAGVVAYVPWNAAGVPRRPGI